MKYESVKCICGKIDESMDRALLLLLNGGYEIIKIDMEPVNLGDITKPPLYEPYLMAVLAKREVIDNG